MRLVPQAPGPPPGPLAALPLQSQLGREADSFDQLKAQLEAALKVGVGVGPMVGVGLASIGTAASAACVIEWRGKKTGGRECV